MQPRCAGNCPQGWAGSLLRRATFSSAGAFGVRWRQPAMAPSELSVAKDPEVALELVGHNRFRPDEGKDERIAIFGMIINYDLMIQRRLMQLICHSHHALLMAMMIVIVAFFLSGMGWAVDASPKDDAYHYMANGVDDQLYNEWWYFDVADNDTQFLVVYLLSDPDNISSAKKDSGAGCGHAGWPASCHGPTPQPRLWRRQKLSHV